MRCMGCEVFPESQKNQEIFFRTIMKSLTENQRDKLLINYVFGKKAAVY